MKERGVGAPTFNNRLTVLSAEEVVRIIEAAPGPGLRCRAAFSVAYGGGLRASEVTHLKVGMLIVIGC